jgi:hypothetical protein
MQPEVQKPESSTIDVKSDGKTLEIRIPGKLTLGFWLFMGFAVLFTFIGWLVYVYEDDVIFLVGGLLISCWFFYVTRPRRELIIFDCDGIQVSGTLRWGTSRSMPFEDIGGFVIKPTGFGIEHAPSILKSMSGLRLQFRHLVTYAFDSFNPQKSRTFLFATTEPIPPDEKPREFNRPLFQDESHDLVLAVQARQEELPWLRSILTNHLKNLSLLRRN